MGQLGHPLDGVDRAEGVRDVGERGDPGPGREKPLEGPDVDDPRIVDGRDSKAGPLLLAQHLPGHDVRVVLEPGQ